MTYIPKEHFNPKSGDDLAQKITDKVANNQLDDAYAILKNGVNAQFSTETLAEKQATWAALSKTLEDNKTLPKLAAEWLSEVAPQLADHDGHISKAALTNIAEHQVNPFYKGMASQMLKEYDTAAKLQDDDGKISLQEVAAFKSRQTQPSNEDFTKYVIADAENTKSPAQAYLYLQSRIYNRNKTETKEEREATWQGICEQMNNHHLVPKLAMGFLDVHADQIGNSKDHGVSFQMMNKISNNNVFLTKELAGFIVKEFPNIATVDYKLDEISPTERKLYKEKIGLSTDQ